MESQHEHLVRLREILEKRFDEQELRTLCFDLGLDYDDLKGEGKSAKARELVALLDRRGRIAELIAIGKRLHPGMAWEVEDAAIPPKVINPPAGVSPSRGTPHLPSSTPTPSGTGSNNLTISGSNFPNANLHVGPQYNVAGDVHFYYLSDIVPIEAQDFSQIITIINNLAANTNDVTIKVDEFNHELEYLINNANIISKEEIKVKMKGSLRGFENTLLWYNTFINETNKQYELAIRQTELGLKELLDIDYQMVSIDKKEISDFIQAINKAEDKIIFCRNAFFELTQQLRQLIISGTIFNDSNRAVGMCIESISAFNKLAQMNLQLFWRTRGTAEGLLRSVS